MPYPNFHSCRLNDPGKYKKMRYKKQGGADVIMGMKEGGDWEVQAIRYPKEGFAEAMAMASCKKHGGTFEAATGSKEHTDALPFQLEPWPDTENPPKCFTDLEENTKMYAQTLKGVEIFKVGKWNNDEYSHSDLDCIVSAFHSAPIKPPLKLGHDEQQKWFGQEQGAPALGWVVNPRRFGDTLIADFENVPDMVVDWIKAKRYRTVSAEIYWNYKDPEGRVYPRALRAVSLLGADIPAVTTLKDLQTALMSDSTRTVCYPQETTSGNYVSNGNAWVYSDGNTEIKWYVYDEYQGGDPMDAEKEKKYTDQIIDLEAKIKKFEDDLKAEKEKTSVAEARALKAEATLASRDEEHAVAQFTTKVDGLVKGGKVLPSEKDGLIATFQALGSGTKKYGEKTVEPRADFLKSLEARPKIIEFKEKGGSTEDKDGALSPAEALDKMAQEFVKEKKCTYNEAVKMVKEADPELWAAYMTPGKGGK